MSEEDSIGFSITDDESSSHRLFDPPLAVQRYIYARNCIQRFSQITPIRWIADFGCNTCGFVKYLKQLPFLTSINCLDINVHDMQRSHYNVKASVMDVLLERPRDQWVNLYLGSVLEQDVRFRHMDVITGLELIEHLKPDTLAILLENVFGFIDPKLVIFSTPNYEYNWVIQRTVAEVYGEEFDESQPPSFRDADHKFEWTRAEFVSWCDEVIAKYPKYTYEIGGAGTLKADAENKTGFCSQFAIFSQKQFSDYGPEVDTSCGTEKYDLYRQYKFKRNLHPKS